MWNLQSSAGFLNLSEIASRRERERGRRVFFLFHFPHQMNDRRVGGRKERLFPPPTAVRAAIRRWKGNYEQCDATVAPPPTKGFMPSGGAASTVAGVAAGGRREAHREGKMARGGKREREREREGGLPGQSKGCPRFAGFPCL